MVREGGNSGGGSEGGGGYGCGGRGEESGVSIIISVLD